ncbi:MAG: hypothetical protein K2R98_13735 [Gemmataceae bacterium]|nr:hypothetical protein [Gemmataceae bacterium]
MTLISLYQDPWFTFRFAESRRIPRFQLEGVAVGQRVVVQAVDPETKQPIRDLAHGMVGNEGWVDLAEPIVVHAGDVFVVKPEVEQP